MGAGRYKFDPRRTSDAVAAPTGYAGAITAALFLQHFAVDAKRWAHLDISAWNDSARPGYPVGGEATGLSAIFHFLRGHLV